MLYYQRTTERDRNSRLWYGVAAVLGGRVEQRYDGLTTDLRSVSGLVERLNREQASLVHFADVIEDYLSYPRDFCR